MQVRYAHTRDEKEAHFRQASATTPIAGSLPSSLSMHVPSHSSLGPSALSSLAAGSLGLGGSAAGVLSPAHMLGGGAGSVAGANAYNQHMLQAQQQMTNNAILQSLMQQQQQQEQIQRALQTQQQQAQAAQVAQQQPEHSMHLMRSFMNLGAPHSAASQQQLSGNVSPVTPVPSSHYYPSAAAGAGGTPVGSYSPSFSSLSHGSHSHYTTAPPLPPAVVIPSSKDLRGPDSCNLFVYNIPDYFSEEQLSHLFGPYGQIISTKVQRDRQTGASKGYGFVSYAEPRAAQLGISNLDGLIIDGKKLTVRLKTKQQDAALPVAPQAQAAQAAQLAAAAAAAAAAAVQQQQQQMYSTGMRGAVGSSGNGSNGNGYATQSPQQLHGRRLQSSTGGSSGGGMMDRRPSTASTYSPMFHSTQHSPYSSPAAQQQQQQQQQLSSNAAAAAANMSNLNSALSGLNLGGVSSSGANNGSGLSQSGGSFFGSPSPVSAQQQQQQQQQNQGTFDSMMHHALYLTHLQHQQAQQGQAQAQQGNNQPAARSTVQQPQRSCDDPQTQLQMYLRSQSQNSQPGNGY